MMMKPSHNMKLAFAVAMVACVLIRPVRHRLLLGGWLIFGSDLYFPSTAFVNTIMDGIIALELKMPDRSYVVPPIHFIDAKDYTPEKFLQTGYGMTETVVVRGLLNTAGSRKWGSEEWIARYGNTKVITNTAGNTSSAAYSDYYTLSESTLGEVDADIQNDLPRLTYGLDEIFIDNPELAKEVEVERFGFGGDQMCRQLGLLYGKANANRAGGLLFHNAGSSNFLMQTSGYKKVTMISNTHSLFFKPVIAGQYDSGFLSSANWDTIADLPVAEVIIGPGDMLQFPSWVWHSTETVAAPKGEPAVPTGQTKRQTKISVGLTCRFPTVFASVYNDAMLELFRTFGWKFGIPKELPAIMRYFPFMRLIVDAKNSMMATIPPWNDLDDCWSSKRTACRLQGVNM